MDIPFFRPVISSDEIGEVTAVLRSGWLTSGPKTHEFEQKFAAFFGGAVEAVAVNSATAGTPSGGRGLRHRAWRQRNRADADFHRDGRGYPLSRRGGRAGRCRAGNKLVDLADAERKLTSACKAIMPVHFGGLPCNMNAVLGFAHSNGLRVIEDAAHAFPARCDGRLIGAWNSDACVFSFYANKTITTGEGGMLVTGNSEIASRARLMRTHGLNRDAFDRFRQVGASWAYDIIAPGFKYNMTDVAAAIGVAQLAKADVLQTTTAESRVRYFDALEGLPLELPAPAPDGYLHSWHLFPVRIREDAPATRDEVIKLLQGQDRLVGSLQAPP